MTRSRTALLAITTGLLAWATGAVSARWQLPPYPQIARGARAVIARWNPAPPAARRRPVAESPEIEALAALGYVQASQPAARDQGVVACVPERMQPGLTLMNSADRADAELVDRDGRTRYRWELPMRAAFPQAYATTLEPPLSRFWRRVHLLPDGALLAIFESHGILKLDRSSRLLWAAANRAHHDVEVAPDGSLYVLTMTDRVLGAGWPAHPVRDNAIVQLSADGRELRAVSLIDALRRSRFAWVLEPGRQAVLEADTRRTRDVLHANELQLLDGSHAARVPAFAAGNLLVSLRTLDTVMVVDMARGEVVWAMRGPWRKQHSATLLENGRMLLLDNMGWAPEPRTTVLEIDPATQELAWQWPAPGTRRIYTRDCGAAHRLGNGNTLVTESREGRAVEVAADGQVVWEYLSPRRVGPLVALLMEATRIDPALTAWLETPP